MCSLTFPFFEAVNWNIQAEVLEISSTCLIFSLGYLLSIRDNLFLMHEATIPYQILTWNVLFCTYFTLKWLIQSQEAFKQIVEL